MSTQQPFVTGPASLRVQSVLYGNDKESIDRALENMAGAIQLAQRAGAITTAEIALGDCSSAPLFTASEIDAREQSLREQGLTRLEYRFFDANLGSAAGHNRLSSTAQADLLLIQNPDIVAAPNLLVELIAPLRLPRVGQVEARQLPVEHPKTYDVNTGDTPWATTACSLIPRAVMEQLGGFDHETFFLYCDDVDFSWRARLAGYRVVFQPSAAAVHDKRLTPQGERMVGAAEEYYSAEAALMLAHKYSRPDMVKRVQRQLEHGGSDTQKRALQTFLKRQAEKRLPGPIDAAHRVAQFTDGYYAKHRW